MWGGLATPVKLRTLALILLLTGCVTEPGASTVAEERKSLFTQLAATHPTIGADEQGDLRAYGTALRGCELFDENPDADLTHVAHTLWWEDHEPWPRHTLQWVVNVGVVLFCPQHLPRTSCPVQRIPTRQPCSPNQIIYQTVVLCPDGSVISRVSGGGHVTEELWERCAGS